MNSDFLSTLWSEQKLVPLVFCLFILLYLAFFPPIFVSIDEHEYAKNASLLVSGQLVNADPLRYCGGQLINNNYQSTYFLGKSVFLIPFLPFGINGLLLSGLVIHLLNAVLFFLILKRLGVDSRLVVLYLFFPAFLWESRTLFPELFALSFALTATYFYLGNRNREWLLSGILFGLATTVRYDSALLITGFAIVSLWQNRKRFAFMLAGFALIGLVVLVINTLLYGSPFQTPYGYSAGSLLTQPNPGYLFNFAVFVGMLLIAYPLMLGVSFFQKKNLGIEVLLSSLAVIALFSRTTDIHLFEFFSPLTITGRMRYLIPVAGLLMLSYAGFVEQTFQKLSGRFKVNANQLVVVLILILVGSGIVSFLVHQESLLKRQVVFSQIQSVVSEDALVIGSSDDCVYFLSGVLGNQKYARVDSAFLDVEKEINAHEGPVYVLALRYSNTSDSSSRQDTIDRERQKITGFIQTHSNRLEKVFENKSPHLLEIYRWTD